MTTTAANTVTKMRTSLTMAMSDDARERKGEREHSAAEAVAHVIGGGDMAALMGDRPEPRKDEVEDGIDEDGIGGGEEAHRAFAEDQRRNGDEGIGGVEG